MVEEEEVKDGLHRTESGDSLYSAGAEAWQAEDEDSEEGSDVPSNRVSWFDLLDPFSHSTEISKTLDTVRKKGDEIRELAKKQREGFKDIARRQRGRMLKDEDLDKLKLQFLRQVDKMEERMTTESAISATEKLTFSLGLFNVFLVGFLIGARPHSVHKLYTIELCLLLPIRCYTYKRKKYHYYLADLCYFANLLSMLYIWVFPQSTILFTACYALAFGTLCWAVIAWRNSLVLHSVDKTTSTFIHILPPTVFHVITHCLDEDFKNARFAGAVKMGNWRFLQGLLWTSVFYFIWQTLYHYFITIKRKDKIEAGVVTSFEHLRKAYGNTRLGKFVNSLPEPGPVIAFTAIQYCFQLFSMLLCPVWYSNPYLSAIFLSYIFLTASYNGATYYIDVFGKRFQKQLLKLQAEVAEMQQDPTSASTSATDLSKHQ